MTNAEHRPLRPLRSIQFSLDGQGVCHAIEPVGELDETAGMMPAKESYVPLAAVNPAMANATAHMMPRRASRPARSLESPHADVRRAPGPGTATVPAGARHRIGGRLKIAQ